MFKQRFTFYCFIVVAVLVFINALGLFNDILEPDGMLYANIAKKIVERNDWINLIVDDKDWLDKPHLPFWITALSFKCFGISAFSYKLPALLSLIAGLFFLYRLALVIYNKLVAAVAMVIYASALHVMLAHFDVRAEPYLTTFIIAAILYLVLAFQQNKMKWFVFAALAIAAAIMTKGIFVLITIGSGFLIYVFDIKALKQLLHWRWVVFLLLIGICCLPELICLYLQFDQHPEKVIFGKQQVSGIRFFLWDSQFGRFFNTGPIKGEGDVSFFIHTTVWAFLPWSILLLAAIWKMFVTPSTNKLISIISGSAISTFMVFSFSKFQLPHYIVILFPHFALFTAQYLVSIHQNNTLKKWNLIQSVCIIIMVFFILFIPFYTQLGQSVWASILIVGVSIIILVVTSKPILFNVLIKGAFFSIGLFYFLHIHFYPDLLAYQSGMVAAKKANNSKAETVYTYKQYAWAFEFYSKAKVKLLTDSALQRISTYPIYLFVRQENMADLVKAGYRYKEIERYPDFRVSMLTASFLNPATRNTQVKFNALIQIDRP